MDLPRLAPRSAATLALLALATLAGPSLAACAVTSPDSEGDESAAGARDDSSEGFAEPDPLLAEVDAPETEVGSPASDDELGRAAGFAPSGDTLPGAGGCSCERPTLKPGVIPTATTVGHCAAPTKVYAASALEGGKLYIDDAFIKKNGSKVVDGIHVNGSIEIKVPGVTLCNFKANSVKITKPDVRVQDGTMISNASLFVNFGPGSSGLATRLYIEGGSADGIRVTSTAPGKTQAVTQSFLTEIAKHRTRTAHADLVQTYPVPAKGTYFSALIQQNYFSSALYGGTASGRAVNATWMSMTDGARFEGNLVDRVFQGFWYQYANPSIAIHDNLFNRSAMDGTKYLGCTPQGNVKHGNNFWFTRTNGTVVKGAKAPTCG